MNIKILKSTFPCTVPVLVGYLSIGMAFGLLLEQAGFGVAWAIFMSTAIYAGSSQFLGVGFLATTPPLAEVAVLTALINFRHTVYGLSMLEKFRTAGKWKPYLIFSLTDETYALISGATPPPHIAPRDFYAAISLLSQIYWVTGSILGSVAGALIPWNTTGVDFAMTALFIVIAVDQWRSFSSHIPALVGGGLSLVCLLVWGEDRFLPPSLGLMTVAMLVLRPKLDKVETTEEVPQ